MCASGQLDISESRGWRTNLGETDVKRTIAMCVTAVALMLATTAAAQRPGTQVSGPVLQGLSACKAVTEAAARLACYDNAAQALEQAVAEKNVVVLDREDLKKTRKTLFGFSLPQLPFFGSNDDSQRETEINTTIKSARSLGYGKWRIQLEDGAVWRTTETSNNVREPRAGLPIRIKRGGLGSYIVNVAGQRGIRAVRES